MRRKAIYVQALVPLLIQGLVPAAMAQQGTTGASPPARPAQSASGSAQSAKPSAPASSASAALAVAAASPPVTPSLADTLSPSARASYDAARLLFGDADYSGALLKFQEAYDAAKDARLLWNMASCEEKLRHYSKASALLTRYLAEAKADLSAQDRVDAYELIHTLAAFSAPLVVTSDPPGVDVTVDGEPAGTTPLAGPISIDQGPRQIVGKKAGYEDSSKTVVVNGGVPVSVTLAMVKIVHEGHLHVHAEAGESILVDGSIVGVGDWEGTLMSGGHTLRVTANHKRPYQSEIVVQDGQTRSVEVSLENEPHGGVPAWVWVTGGVLVAGGAGVAGYFIFKPADTPGAPTVVGTAPEGTVMQHGRLHR